MMLWFKYMLTQFKLRFRRVQFLTLAGVVNAYLQTDFPDAQVVVFIGVWNCPETEEMIPLANCLLLPSPDAQASGSRHKAW
jgi:hypothetical protein